MGTLLENPETDLGEPPKELLKESQYNNKRTNGFIFNKNGMVRIEKIKEVDIKDT